VGLRVMAAAAVATLALSFVCTADATQAVTTSDGSLVVVEGESPSIWSSGSVVYAFSGTLQRGFSAPAVLSEPGDEAELPVLATDAAGDVLAVWTASRTYREHPETLRGPHQVTVRRGIWFAWRSTGGLFSAPRQLAAPAPGQSRVLVAIDKAGEATVAYEERGSVYLRRAVRNGAFGVATAVFSGTSEPGGQPANLVYLGVDDAGGLLVVGSRGSLLQARTTSTNGELSRAQTMAAPQPSGGFVRRVVATMNGHGQAVIAWEESNLSGIFAVYRKGRGRFGPRQRLAAIETRPSSETVWYLSDVFLNARGVAVFVVLRSFRTTGLVPPAYPEIVEWNGHGEGLAPVPLSGAGYLTEGGFSITRNDAGEAAVAYRAVVGEGQLAVYARFSSSGRGFGSPLAIEVGASSCLNVGLERVELPFKENPACEGTPMLVAAEDNTFLAVSSFWVDRGHSTYAQLVRVRSISEVGASPADTVALPDHALPGPALGPATLTDFGASTTPDHHARIHGRVQCGAVEGGCSVGISINEAASPGRTVGHATVLLGYLGSRSIAVSLNGIGRRELARHSRLDVRVMTNTVGAYGPALDSAYPLTIIAAPAARRGRRVRRTAVVTRANARECREPIGDRTRHGCRASKAKRRQTP